MLTPAFHIYRPHIPGFRQLQTKDAVRPVLAVFTPNAYKLLFLTIIPPIAAIDKVLASCWEVCHLEMIYAILEDDSMLSVNPIPCLT